MAVTTVTSLADSEELIIDSARLVREKEGVFMRVCDWETLPENSGMRWEEIAISALTAQSISETTILDNPQSLVDTMFSIEPTMTGVETAITRRVQERLSKKVLAKIGPLKQNAIQRKKDQDYLATHAGATNTLAGTGQTMSQGFVSSAVARIEGNATEPGHGPFFTVLHGYVLKDIVDEVKGAIGTYTITPGLTQEFYQHGFKGMVADTNVYVDNNITINATPDARGAVHSKDAIVGVQGFKQRMWTVFHPEIGGGTDLQYMYDDYAFGERSAGNWLYGLLADATAPS